MMMWWTHTWKADDYQDEEAPEVVVEEVPPRDTPVSLKTDLPMATTAGEEVEFLVLSPLLPTGTPLYSPLPCDAFALLRTIL